MTCLILQDWYDRQGKHITCAREIARLFTNISYKRVAETTLSNGTRVSTVWLGLDHNFGMGRPLIFETMVFSSRGTGADSDCERYAMEAEALEGHARMVRRWEIGEE